MYKALKFFLKFFSKMIELAIFGLGLAMLYFLTQSILLEEGRGYYTVYASCDRHCYDSLGLDKTTEYSDELIVRFEREYIGCTYLTLFGLRYDDVWQSPWEPQKTGGENFKGLRSASWPLTDMAFNNVGRAIREPQYNFEKGCRPNI
ncbi:MAG: hypothetical protein R3E57_07280 [Porticoccaceae bacterium]